MLGDGLNVLRVFGDSEFEVAAHWELKIFYGRKRKECNCIQANL